MNKAINYYFLDSYNNNVLLSFILLFFFIRKLKYFLFKLSWISVHAKNG
jgi:hypothetical protein